MSVKLVGITKPMIEGLGSAEDLVAYAARVSNPANQMNSETAPKLLKYLAKHQHWSPFEMVSLTMEIETTRDIARQILRHRSMSFQEFSQRYADASQLGFVKREARLQDTKNRQNSIETDDEKLQLWWNNVQDDTIEEVKRRYAEALRKGIAKEQARAILPEGITVSRLYMSGTLRSWIHFCQLRCSNGTQLEHQLIAEECRDIVIQQFPSVGYLFGED